MQSRQEALHTTEGESKTKRVGKTYGINNHEEINQEIKVISDSRAGWTTLWKMVQKHGLSKHGRMENLKS